MAATHVFYLTLLFIFLTAIITAVVTKWAKDKCLQLFNDYHITLESLRGSLDWGRFKCFSSGMEILYDHAYVDSRGRKKTSYMIYQQEIESMVLSLLRYHDELDEEKQQERLAQVHRRFNPGPLRRMARKVRNFINTLRDAFGTAIGAVVTQYQARYALLAAQGGNVTQMGQTLLGKFANAYEPLLEQYIGQPVILTVVDPLDPNNATVQYAGYLADYTQQFIALFNVEHTTAQWITITLPDVEKGDVLPPLPPPPAPGSAPLVLPPPLKVEEQIAIRIDGGKFKIQNLRCESLVVRRVERSGFQPLPLGVVLPPKGTLSLVASDVRGGQLVMELIRCLDVVAPRKYATVRHAGELVERRGLVDDLHLAELPLVPILLSKVKGEEGHKDQN